MFRAESGENAAKDLSKLPMSNQTRALLVLRAEPHLRSAELFEIYGRSDTALAFE